MPETITVYVYGHYDSRGGTTAIAAESRAQADDAYNEHSGWTEMLADYRADPSSWTWDPTNPERWPSAEDFLYEARLTGDPIPDDGDLESEFDSDNPGEVWCRVAQEEIEARRTEIANYEADDPETQARVRDLADEMTDAQIAGELAVSRSESVRDLMYVPCRPLDEEHVLCQTPVSVGGWRPFLTEAYGREDGWVHPRWDDDAFHFVLEHV